MKFKSVEKVHQGKFVTRYDITYETEKGNIKRYEMLSRNPDITDFDGIKSDKSEAVVLIMHDKDNSKILLNKEYRMAVGNVAINFPAGLIDPGEDAKTAAGRELWEETGLKLVEVKAHWPSSYSAVGLTNEISAQWYTKEEVKELLNTSIDFAARTQAYCYMWAYGA